MDTLVVLTLTFVAFLVWWFRSSSPSAFAVGCRHHPSPFLSTEGKEKKKKNEETPLHRTVREGLRPFVRRDAPRVRRILEGMESFSRRYARLLRRRPGRGAPHVMVHAYERLYDDHVRLLNLAHELYLSGANDAAADAALTEVMRVVQSHTSRMLRVLRHKYPEDLRAVRNNSVPVATVAPTHRSSFDPFV